MKSYIIWNEAGTKKIEYLYFIDNKNNKKIKEVNKIWNNNKLCYQYEHINNIRSGYHMRCYENDNKCEEGHYNPINGTKTGIWYTWYENGQMKSMGEYRSFDIDEKYGLWVGWYQNGTKEYEKIYKNDKLIQTIQWNKDGKFVYHCNHNEYFIKHCIKRMSILFSLAVCCEISIFYYLLQ